MDFGLGERGVRRDATQVPTSAIADDVITAVQPLLSLAIVVMCVVTVDPLGANGRGLYGVVLLVVNAVVALTRTLPDSLIGERRRLVLCIVGCLSAGLFFGFDAHSFAPAFAFIIAMHVGIRFEPRLAVALTTVVVAIAAVLLLVADDSSSWPWWTSLFLYGTVTAGIMRRNRVETLDNAHALVEQTRRTAASEARARTLAERARMARDIHDVLAHSLSGVNMQLSLAEALFEAGRVEEGRAAVRTSQGLVVDGLQEARRAVQTLREDTLDLLPTLDRLVSGEHESLEVRGTPVTLSSEQTTTVVRTAQEALTNARRHAPDAPITVVLTYDDDVRLDVTNGPSTAAATSEGSGMGLVGMRERAALLGARVAAGPDPGGGWHVCLEFDRSAG